MARVLVTGGTGFIGRHLVNRLQARGDQVRCLLHRQEPPIPGVECVRGEGSQETLMFEPTQSGLTPIGIGGGTDATTVTLLVA